MSIYKHGKLRGCIGMIAPTASHIRIFPRYRMQDRKATDVGLVYHLAEIARKNLKYVYSGNC